MALELNYSNLDGQVSMLRDSIRCKAFQRAINEIVTPGCIVLDIGAGTGILSIFAAQAGAKTVYAVEQTKIAEVATQIVAANGLSDRVKVLQGDMAAIQLPEKVDVIISEWLGGYGVDENLLPIVLQARDRWLKPGGKMMPASVIAWMAPVLDEQLEREIHFWQSDPYGLNLDLIAEATGRQLQCACNHVKQKHLISTPQVMWETDSMTDTLENATQPFRAELEFIAERDGQFNALAAWFSATLSDQVLLRNGPSDPDTHWGRHIFPAGKTVEVEKGMKIRVQFCMEPCGKGQSNTAWTLETPDYHFQSEGLTVLTEQGDEARSY
jgi:precorrin-6B methylase 2